MATQTTAALPDLDLSTSVPVSPTPAAQSSALPELDMSTSVPAPGTTGVFGFLNQVGVGGAEAMHDIWGVAKGMIPGGPAETGVLKTIWNNLPPVQLADSVKQTLPLIHTYEQARSSGASMSDALTKVNETAKQHMSNITAVKPVVDAFRANPTRETARALLDATAAATSMLVGGEAIAPEAEAGAAPAAEAEAVGSPSWLQRMNPFRKATVSESGLPVGTPETTVPTGETIQPGIHGTIRGFVNQVNKANGLNPIPDDVSVLDVAQKQADAFQVRSQSTFAAVEKLTGVNPTTLRDIMSTRTDQIEELAAAGKDEEAGNLQQLQLKDADRMKKAFDAAEKKGIPVTQAQDDWNKSLRADEFSSAIRASKSKINTLANPDIDPEKLTPRLQKLMESQPGSKTAKLAQLGGDTNAKSLVESAENARGAEQTIADFKPSTATGQQALNNIVRSNTGAGKVQAVRQALGFSPTTNWIGAFMDFNKLEDADVVAQFGADAPKAASFLKSQARGQVIKGLAKLGTVAGVAHVLGVDKAILHTILAD